MTARILPLLALTLAGALLMSAATLAQRRGTAILPVEQVRPGMRGHGLTVFRGTQPERFDVEVIDVLHNFRPNQHLILARTPHPVLDHAKAVGGMSGSPIYLDGKLAGAYAYGWQFGTDPVVGITPIENMLADIARPLRPDSVPGLRPLASLRQPRPATRHTPHLAGLAPYRGGPRSALDPLREHIAQLARPTHPQTLTPVATPMMLAGFDDEVAALLGRELESFGLVTLQGGGGQGSAAPGDRPRFVDGGAIGVQLIRGDISATAIGTVTHVGDDDRLVAFGHPMMNMGEIGLPTSTARVLHILASTARSFKIAEALEPQGTLIHDRQADIVVDTSLRAPTIPVNIRLHGIDAPRTEWNVEVASHRTLSPMLVFGALANAIKTTSPDQTDVMYRARYAVDLAGYGRVELRDEGYMAAGPTDIGQLARLRLFELFEVAYGNPFEPSRVEGVDIDLDIRFARDVLELVEASVGAAEIDPGSDVDVRLRFRRYGRPDVVRHVQVHIPEEAAGQTVRLAIDPGSSVRHERPTPRNIADLVRAVQDRFSSTSIVASLKMPSRGLRFEGHVVRSLPRSALNSLRRVTGTGPTGNPFITYLRRPIEVGEVVVGSEHIDLHVREVPLARSR